VLLSVDGARRCQQDDRVALFAAKRQCHSAATWAFDDGRLSSWNLIAGVLVPWP
jgi:hypothetical protein